jgi:hypothetical protein
LRIAATLLALTLAVSAQTKRVISDSAADHFPIKRVVLYKNGVGYFEHVGKVNGSQEFSVDFTTAQLNDVLKSLTVLDFGEGKISAIRYNSVAPISQRLSGLRLSLGETATRADFLNALRGTRIEVRSGTRTATGKLLSVERQRRINTKGDSTEATELAVITDAGELRSFELSPDTGIRIVDRELSQDVNRYLTTIGSNHGADIRRMYIATAGTGERSVMLSYISEVPVWKTTYRLILPDKPGGQPLLQGWAIVDNTVGEDWNNVQLSLVAGAPQSFVQDISQPYYVRRPVVSLPDAVNATPQSHEPAITPPPPPAPVTKASGTSLQGTVKDPSGAVIPGATVTVRNDSNGASQSAVTDSNGFYVFHNVSSGNTALFVEHTGFQRFALTNIYLGTGRVNEIHATLQVGNASEMVEVTANAPIINTTQSSMLSSVAPEAEGGTVGDLYSYDLKQKITIGKDQSALVPILQARIDAEKVSVWNDASFTPLRALWLKNISSETLDGGTFNVIDADTFAGEGILDPIHRGERRLISYALDTAVHVSRDRHGKTSEDDDDDDDQPGKPVQTLHLVRINKGVMFVTTEQRSHDTYTVHNADSTPREVIIEHKSGKDWKLANNLKPEESTANLHRFRVKVDGGATARLEVEQYRPMESNYTLTNIDSDQFVLFTNSKLLTPDLEHVLADAIKTKAEIASLDSQIRYREAEVQKIGTDQNRLRENMKALKGSSEERALLQRYTHELEFQEDRLATLQKEADELRSKRTKLKADLEQQLGAINYEPQHSGT